MAKCKTRVIKNPPTEDDIKFLKENLKPCISKIPDPPDLKKIVADMYDRKLINAAEEAALSVLVRNRWGLRSFMEEFDIRTPAGSFTIELGKTIMHNGNQ